LNACIVSIDLIFARKSIFSNDLKYFLPALQAILKLKTGTKQERLFFRKLSILYLNKKL